MAARVHIGAKDLRGDLAAYAKRFDLLEVRGMDAASQHLAPSTATLRRWRRAVPPKFEFSVVAGPNLAKLRPNDTFEAELKTMLATATTLEARVLVIATPVDVTPSKLWRDRLARVVERLPRDANAIVWEPSGLWEVEDAVRFAKTLGVVVGVDPAREEVPAGPVAYGRLRAVGATRAFSTAALQRIAAKMGERNDAYVLIETTGALKEAKTLRGLMRNLKTSARAGFGRLIRPRGAPLRVADDEQEE